MNGVTCPEDSATNSTTKYRKCQGRSFTSFQMFHAHKQQTNVLIQLMIKDHKHRVIIDIVHGNLATSIHPR